MRSGSPSSVPVPSRCRALLPRLRPARPWRLGFGRRGGQSPGRRGGRNLTAKAALVAVAVEVRGNGSGRVRMKVIPNASGETLSSFVAETVVPGAIVHTDGWQGYAPLTKKSSDHRPRSGRAAKKAGDPDPVLPREHRAISNVKTWLRGTHRSVSNEPAGLHRRVHLPLQQARHAEVLT